MKTLGPGNCSIISLYTKIVDSTAFDFHKGYSGEIKSLPPKSVRTSVS